MQFLRQRSREQNSSTNLHGDLHFMKVTRHASPQTPLGPLLMHPGEQASKAGRQASLQAFDCRLQSSVTVRKQLSQDRLQVGVSSTMHLALHSAGSSSLPQKRSPSSGLVITPLHLPFSQAALHNSPGVSSPLAMTQLQRTSTAAITEVKLAMIDDEKVRLDRVCTS